MRSAEIIRSINEAGSHKHFRHASLPGTVTVSHPKADIAIGTLKSVEKQSGAKLRCK